MKKMIVVIGLIIVIIGGVLMGIGQMMKDSATPTIVDCSTTAGTLKRLYDTKYASDCDDAVNSYNSGNMICFGGVPMLIVGVIIMIAGLVMKEAPQSYGQMPPQPYQQPAPQYAPAPAYQQPPPQPYGPPPQYQQYSPPPPPPQYPQYPPYQQPPQYPPPR